MQHFLQEQQVKLKELTSEQKSCRAEQDFNRRDKTNDRNYFKTKYKL